MSRDQIFAAIRSARADRPFSGSDVRAIDDLLDRLGVGRDGTDQSFPPAIGMVSAELITKACPGAPAAEMARWVQPIRNACLRFEIDTIRRVAAFIAQMAHESGSFIRLEENLNYTTAARIKEVWPSRFTIASAWQCVRNPERLANTVYANRMGNGPPESGDGWKFRGAGPLQITGRDNWTAFAAKMRMPLDDALAYGRTAEGGVMAAAWFWEANDINRLADTPGVTDESRRINGGTNGLLDRKARFDSLVSAMLKMERMAA